MSSFGGAQLGNGISYGLEYVDATYPTHRRNLAVEYLTTQGKTCFTPVASTWAIDNALAFAGIASIDYPWASPPQDLDHPYGATTLSAGYPTFSATDMELTPSQVAVIHKARTFAIPAETITPGQFIMLTNIADHTATTDTHNGMISPADSGTANEMYASVGICETPITIPATHALHDDYWDQNLGEFTLPVTGTLAADRRHPLVWVNLYR